MLPEPAALEPRTWKRQSVTSAHNAFRPRRKPQEGLLQLFTTCPGVTKYAICNWMSIIFTPNLFRGLLWYLPTRTAFKPFRDYLHSTSIQRLCYIYDKLVKVALPCYSIPRSCHPLLVLNNNREQFLYNSSHPSYQMAALKKAPPIQGLNDAKSLVSSITDASEVHSNSKRLCHIADRQNCNIEGEVQSRWVEETCGWIIQFCSQCH